MKRPYKYKNILQSFKNMYELNEKKKLYFVAPGTSLNNEQIEIWKNGNNFEFSLKFSSFDIALTNYSTIFDSCILTNGKKNYRFQKDALASCSIGLGKEETSGKLTSIIEFNEYNSKSAYFRLIQPNKGNSNASLITGAIDLKTDQKDVSLYGGGYNQIKIQNELFDVFRISDKSEEYLVLDSCSKVEFKDFKTATDYFLASFAFCFGNYLGNESYFVSSPEINFETTNQVVFLRKPDSINDNYPIFNKKTSFEKGLVFFPKNVFETICNNVEIKEFSRTLDIIKDALQSPSPLGKCILFASAIETITTLIHEDKESPVPIDKERYKKSKLRERIKNIIKENKSLTEDDKSFLIDKKINYLNTPSGIDKTIEALRTYGITLPKDLEKVLSYRNRYLHGSIPKDDQFSFEIDNLTRAYEMQFLISILILKYSGFSGYVQNKSTIMEYHAHMKNNSFDDNELTHALYYKI